MERDMDEKTDLISKGCAYLGGKMTTLSLSPWALITQSTVIDIQLIFVVFCSSFSLLSWLVYSIEPPNKSLAVHWTELKQRLLPCIKIADIEISSEIAIRLYYIKKKKQQLVIFALARIHQKTESGCFPCIHNQSRQRDRKEQWQKRRDTFFFIRDTFNSREKKIVTEFQCCMLPSYIMFFLG